MCACRSTPPFTRDQFTLRRTSPNTYYSSVRPARALSFLFDHIREPVPAIAELFTDDPPVRDSRTYAVDPLEMKEGDLLGTSIGTLEDGNAFVDFGINDNFGRLPTPQHPNAHGRFLSTVCIYTFFDPDTAAYLRSVEHPQLVAEEGSLPIGQGYDPAQARLLATSTIGTRRDPRHQMLGGALVRLSLSLPT